MPANIAPRPIPRPRHGVVTRSCAAERSHESLAIVYGLVAYRPAKITVVEPTRPTFHAVAGTSAIAAVLLVTAAGCGHDDSPPPAWVTSRPTAPESSPPPTAATDSTRPGAPGQTSGPGAKPTAKPTRKPTSSGGTTKVDFVTALANDWPSKVKAGSKITVRVEVSGDPVAVLVRLKGSCYADKQRYPRANFYLQWHGKWSNKIIAGSVPHPAIATVSAKIPKQCGAATPASGGPEVADAGTKKPYGLDGHDFDVYR